MLTDEQVNNPSLIVIPTDEAAIGAFNAVFCQFTQLFLQHFPNEPCFRRLHAFALSVHELDSAHMLLGVRVWLDYFNTSLYGFIQACDEQLWDHTTFIGIPMKFFWSKLNLAEQQKYWLFIQVLVNLANILRQVPQERLIQLNSVIVNFKDLCARSLPFISDLVMTAASGLANDPNGKNLMSTLMTLAPGFGGVQ